MSNKKLASLLALQLLVLVGFVGAELAGRQGFSLFSGLAGEQDGDPGARQLAGSSSGMGAGALQSVGSLLVGLGEDERNMMRRELEVAGRILSLVNERLQDTNGNNLATFDQDVASLTMDSTRSLGQPVNSMFNRIMGRL